MGWLPDDGRPGGRRGQTAVTRETRLDRKISGSRTGDQGSASGRPATGRRAGGAGQARPQRFQRVAACAGWHVETAPALHRIRHARHCRRRPERNAVGRPEVIAQGVAWRATWCARLQRTCARPRPGSLCRQQDQGTGRHRQQARRFALQPVALQRMGGSSTRTPTSSSSSATPCRKVRVPGSVRC